MGTKITALAEATALAVADVFVAVVGGVTKKITKANLQVTLGIDGKAERWKEITDSYYTDTPHADLNKILMSNTGDFKVGAPVKFTETASGNTYYGIVDTLSTNAFITIKGAPLDAGDDIAALYVGLPELAMQIDLFVSGTYGDGSANLLADDMLTYFKWRLPKAYLVAFSIVHYTVDGGVEPKVNMRVNASDASTYDGGNGPQLGGAGAWVDNGDVEIDPTTYDINYGEALEVFCSVAGGVGNASDLTVSCTFVSE